MLTIDYLSMLAIKEKGGKRQDLSLGVPGTELGKFEVKTKIAVFYVKEVMLPLENVSLHLSNHSSFSSSSTVTGHQRLGHGERVKCHKNVGQHLPHHQLAHWLRLHLLLLAKFPMAPSAKIWPRPLKFARPNLHKRDAAVKIFTEESQICSRRKNLSKSCPCCSCVSVLDSQRSE